MLSQLAARSQHQHVVAVMVALREADFVEVGFGDSAVARVLTVLVPHDELEEIPSRLLDIRPPQRACASSAQLSHDPIDSKFTCKLMLRRREAVAGGSTADGCDWAEAAARAVVGAANAVATAIPDALKGSAKISEAVIMSPTIAPHTCRPSHESHATIHNSAKWCARCKE